MSLILASSSPFRKAVLERLDIDFSTVSPDIDESRHAGETPHDLVYRLSAEKAREVAKTHSGLIIASDQVATLASGNGSNDEVLTKPHTRENAVKQLQKKCWKHGYFSHQSCVIQYRDRYVTKSC